MLYKCVWVGGDDVEVDGGIWEFKETSKTYVWKQVEESKSFQPVYTKVIVKKERAGRNYNDWGDGTYTIYPFSCGTPYFFEPIVSPVPRI